jgi:hypothetical protein
VSRGWTNNSEMAMMKSIKTSSEESTSQFVWCSPIDPIGHLSRKEIRQKCKLIPLGASTRQRFAASLVFYRAVALHSDVHRGGENVLRRTTLLVKGGLVPRPSRVSTGHLSERSRIIRKGIFSKRSSKWSGEVRHRAFTPTLL